jgi:ATP-binding cassette, subfamily C, bacterial CydD
VVAGLLVIPQAVLLAVAVAGVVFPAEARLPLPLALGTVAALAALRALASWGADTLALGATSRTKARIRIDLMGRLLAAGPAWLSAERTGELTQTWAAGLDHLDAYEGSYRLQRLLAVVVPAAVLAVTALLDPLSAVVLLVTGPLIPLFMVLLGGAAREQSERQFTALSRLGARFLDAVQAIPTLAAFGQIEAEAGRLSLVAGEHRRLTMTVLRVAFLSALVLEWLATLGTAIVAVEVGLRLLYDRVAFMPALAVLMLAPEFYRPLRALGGAFHAGLAGRDVSSRLAVLDDALPDRQDAETTALAHVPVRLQLRAVTVERPTLEKPALAEISLDIAPGEWVAVIGPSGAGKSTLLGLWLGFVTAASGHVTVDGHAVTPATSAALRRQIAWAPQRPHIFHGTLRSNLLLARPDATDRALHDAITHAALGPLVTRLPRGLDTPLGEGGAGLSGGELQRLALARALLADAPVLLLDEPTSELDPDTEHAVLTTLQACTGVTRVMVTHRASAARWADRVIELRDGRLVSRGSGQ